MSHLYKVETNVNREEYYVIAEDMNMAEAKLKEHLGDTYSNVIITNLSYVAGAPTSVTNKRFNYQFKLIL